MQREYEYEKLLKEMYKIDVESNLASPLAGSGTVEISPVDTVRKIVSDFFFSLEKDNIQGIAVLDNYCKKLEWDATVESQGIKEGSKLYLVYDGSSFFRPLHTTLIGISVVIIASVLFITASVLFGATGGDIPFDYGIVVDAGSTHTEVFLYQWSGSKFHGTGEVHQKSFCLIESGIAKAFDPADLVLCVNKVLKTLPQDMTSPVTLYLGATAGMRLLNITNPLNAHLILTALKYALKTTSVKEGSIEIIQGENEGLFSWITTNFLSMRLQQNEVNDTYGALDLGGASTQFAFALNADTNISYTTALKLYGTKYIVISKSFLCFGLSKASGRIEAILFMHSWSTDIQDPCLPKNYSLILKSKEFLKPCIANDNINKWLHENSNVSELRVVGISIYEECKEVVKMLVNQSSCLSTGFKYCLNTTHIAEPNRKFMAFSSFYYIVNYLSPNGSLEDFVEATKSFCSLSFEQIKERAHDEAELSHLLTYCFGAVYVTELLTSNYGFNNSSWKNILFQQSIKGTDVGWSLGLMINASNAIPEEAPRPPLITLSVFIPLLGISVLLGFLASYLLQKNHKFCQKTKKDSLLESMA